MVKFFKFLDKVHDCWLVFTHCLAVVCKKIYALVMATCFAVMMVVFLIALTDVVLGHGLVLEQWILNLKVLYQEMVYRH